jgi:hypothetical protein
VTPKQVIQPIIDAYGDEQFNKRRNLLTSKERLVLRLHTGRVINRMYRVLRSAEWTERYLQPKEERQ